MSALLEYIMNFFISKECYAIYAEEGNLLHGECLQLFMSKIIGYAIVILSSTMVKMPQILKILGNKSAEGVSLSSHLLLVFSGTTGFTYGLARGFPISVWGENVAMAIQNTVICMLICLYCGRRTHLACMIGLLSLAAMVLFSSNLTPMIVHRSMAMCQLPIVTFSKIIQIYTVYTNQSTGQLSMLSICMLNFRSFGRFFTYLVETDDLNKVAVYACASLCNVILLGQMVYYGMLARRKLKEA